MTVHSSYIHISQIPEQWEGKATYNNDLIYQYKEAMMTSQDCRDYLERKIKQLNKKMEIESASHGHRRRWINQLEIYEAMLKYLTLYKI